jgi:hypothetical protein
VREVGVLQNRAVVAARGLHPVPVCAKTAPEVAVNPNIKLVESAQLSWWISLCFFSTANVFTKRIVGN